MAKRVHQYLCDIWSEGTIAEGYKKCEDFLKVVGFQNFIYGNFDRFSSNLAKHIISNSLDDSVSQENQSISSNHFLGEIPSNILLLKAK